jgi:hypothetical protein
MRPTCPARSHALAAAALALAAPAQALVIDDFAEPINTNYVGYASGPAGFSIPSSLAPAAVPGGWRSMAISADLQATGTTFASLNGGSELWGFGTGEQRLAFSFSYGTVTAMNLDLSGTTVLRLDMYLSTPMKLVVYATTQTSPGANPDGSAFGVDMPALFEQSFDIPLAAFSVNSSTGQAVNWGDVDGLWFALSASGPTSAGGDAVWLRGLAALPVPEPSSWVTLAAGLALLLGACGAGPARPAPRRDPSNVAKPVRPTPGVA